MGCTTFGGFSSFLTIVRKNLIHEHSPGAL